MGSYFPGVSRQGEAMITSEPRSDRTKVCKSPIGIIDATRQPPVMPLRMPTDLARARFMWHIDRRGLTCCILIRFRGRP